MTKTIAILGLVATATACFFCAQFTLSQQFLASNNTPTTTRELSTVSDIDECALKPAVAASKEVMPSFVASYPGSGSSMVRVLIPALTGIKMSVPRQVDGDHLNVVALKTHYPVIHYMPEWTKKVERVVILVRNPMNSIPSQFNFVYERDNGLTIHSVKAPTEAWVRWRDENLLLELGRWVELVDFWMQNDDIKERFVLAYEDLTSDETGPSTATRLTEFFNQSPGVNNHSAEKVSIPCIWRKVLKGDGDLKVIQRRTNMKRQGSKTPREFTVEQLGAMTDALQKLAEKYKAQNDLFATLNRYKEEVSIRYQS